MHKTKLIEWKREINDSTIIIGNSITPLSIMNRTTRQKINQGVEDLNNIVN